VDLDGIRAVLQGVVGTLRLPRQAAEFAHWHHADSERVGHRSAKNEPAALDTDDRVDIRVGPRQRVDRQPQRLPIAQQRGDVAEQDAGLGKIGDVPHERGQCGGRLLILFLFLFRTKVNHALPHRVS
jgi:hypothetical protein